MKFFNPRILLTMSRENRRALRDLHAAVGFDFEKPVFALRVEAPFTWNSIRKQIPDLTETECAVVMVERKESYHGARWNYIRLNPDGFGTEPPRKSYFPFNGCEKLYTKSDAENIRKKTAHHAYVIGQHVSNLAPVRTRRPLDPLARICEPKPNEWHFRDRATGRVFTEIYTVPDYSPYQRMKAEDFDKSGYYLPLKRNELKRRANDLRKQREKERASTVDFSKETKTLRDTFETLRRKTISGLASASKSYEFGAVYNAVFFIRWHYADVERAEQRTNDRAWTSVDFARETLSDLTARVEKELNEFRAAYFGEYVTDHDKQETA